jgi:hypothetical protein
MSLSSLLRRSASWDRLQDANPDDPPHHTSVLTLVRGLWTWRGVASPQHQGPLGHDAACAWFSAVVQPAQLYQPPRSYPICTSQGQTYSGRTSVSPDPPVMRDRSMDDLPRLNLSEGRWGG